MSPSSSDSFITPRAIGFGSGLEGQVPESLGSSLKEPESPLEAWAELSAELDAKGVEVDTNSRAGVDALVAFTMSFFLFFSAGGQTADDEARPFSPDALLNFPFCLLFSRCSRRS